MNCLSSFIYYVVRLGDLVPIFCIRDTALEVSTTTWQGTQALDAAWTAWLISQCTKRLVPGTSSAQANCGLQSPNRCTLRFCAVVRLSIGPVDDVGSITETYENLEGNAVRWRSMNAMKDKPPCWLINGDCLDLMLRSSKCRRRKHI